MFVFPCVLHCEPYPDVARATWCRGELHRRGIEVILDVVFNHTAEGALPKKTFDRHGGCESGGDSFSLASIQQPLRDVWGIFDDFLIDYQIRVLNCKQANDWSRSTGDCRQWDQFGRSWHIWSSFLCLTVNHVKFLEEMRCLGRTFLA